MVEYVLHNQKEGIQYGWNKDYDNLGNEDAVINLLHHGLKSKYAKEGECTRFCGFLFAVNVVYVIHGEMSDVSA